MDCLATSNGPELVKQLDFFSHDQYPLFYDSWPGRAEGLVQARSLSFPFAIMEQQSGPGGQMSYLQRTPRPGETGFGRGNRLRMGRSWLVFSCGGLVLLGLSNTGMGSWTRTIKTRGGWRRLNSLAARRIGCRGIFLMRRRRRSLLCFEILIMRSMRGEINTYTKAGAGGACSLAAAVVHGACAG